MEKLALVACGGALGAVLRLQTSAWAARLTGEGFFGTAFVNVTGSFMMGLLAVLMIEALPGGWGRWAPFAMTGLLGAYTTFSAFSLDTLYLVERGRLGTVGVYIAGSVLLSIAGLWLGLRVARAII